MMNDVVKQVINKLSATLAQIESQWTYPLTPFEKITVQNLKDSIDMLSNDAALRQAGGGMTDSPPSFQEAEKVLMDVYGAETTQELYESWIDIEHVRMLLDALVSAYQRGSSQANAPAPDAAGQE